MFVEEPQENYKTGWIKVYRSIQNKGWYKKSEYVHLWIHLLIKANHKGIEFWFNGKNIKLDSGQFVTGRKSLSSETGISESKIQRILKFFENEQQIEQQTSNVNRLISVLNWNDYQISEQQIEQPVNNKRTTSEQRVNTNKNEKNIKNDKNVRIDYTEIMKIFNSMMTNVPKINSITEKRKKNIDAVLKENDLLTIGEVFKKVSQSDFLNGKNDNGWTANFDWIFNKNNFVKILEGNYDNKNGKQITINKQSPETILSNSTGWEIPKHMKL